MLSVDIDPGEREWGKAGRSGAERKRAFIFKREKKERTKRFLDRERWWFIQGAAQERGKENRSPKPLGLDYRKFGFMILGG